MKICVVGLGYVGLPSACIFAEAGHFVTGVDVSKNVLEKITCNNPSFEEPLLDKLLKKVIKSGNLQISSFPINADIYVICVPTPLKDNFKPDIGFVKSVVENLSKVIKNNSLVIIESTIPYGTTSLMKDYILELNPNIKSNEIFFAHCPERVLPGNAIYEIKNNNRVIGGLSKESGIRAKEFYQSFSNGDIQVTDAGTAELVKLVENSYRDVNIAFANEIANICENIDTDHETLIKLANKHPRVDILKPGPGVGGHCIPVDPWFLVDGFKNDTLLINTARKINLEKVNRVVTKAISLSKSHNLNQIYLLGLSYKANIGDFRESPSIEIMDKLSSQTSFKIIAIDPYLNTRNFISNQIETFRGIEIFENDSLILGLVKHKEFSELELKNDTQKNIYYVNYC